MAKASIFRVRMESLAGSRALVFGFLLAALVAVSLLTARPAHASTTFVVNSTGDGADADTNDGVCDTSFSRGEQCTLRAAIEEADVTPGADTIDFNIGGGSGVKTISPSSSLPTITEAVTIDGYSQPGTSPNTLAQGSDAALLIELNGEGAGAGSSGLSILASNVVVKGLVINRFGQQGIEILDGTTGNAIEGDFIGTDALGTTDLGNHINGLLIASASDNTVGDASPAARNVISGNDVDGIFIAGSATGNVVEGNFIGTDKGGTNALGNRSAGVRIANGASDNAVGGQAFGAPNVIAFNGFDGITIHKFAAGFDDPTGNRVLGNSVFSNGDLGIDLADDGRTDNDKKDPDTGPNALQNFPVLTSATTSSAGTIKGKLNSVPKETFIVQFFSNPGGPGVEGQTFIGEKSVRTNRKGKASFTFSPAQAVSVGGAITATATSSGGNTSEFSDPREVVQL